MEIKEGKVGSPTKILKVGEASKIKVLSNNNNHYILHPKREKSKLEDTLEKLSNKGALTLLFKV